MIYFSDFSAASGGASDPNWANVVFLSGFAGADGSTTFTDESSYARAMTRSGQAQVDTAQSVFGGTSLLLDGTGDYLTSTNITDLNFGTGQFTVEAFVRWSATPTADVICSLLGSNNGSSVWSLHGSATGLTFRLWPTATVQTVSAPWSPVANTWYHVAVDRDAAGKIRLYVDGAMIGSATNTSGMQAGSPQLFVGSGFGVNYWEGWLDEVRITKGVARYASDSGYTVPTAAFPRS